MLYTDKPHANLWGEIIMKNRDRMLTIAAGGILCVFLAFFIYQGISAEIGNKEPVNETGTDVFSSSEKVLSESSSVPVSSTVSKYVSKSSDLLTQLQEGDFSNFQENIEGKAPSLNTIQEVYEAGIINKFNEFLRYDLNGDGIDELIWQEKEGYYNGNMKPVIGIFVQEFGKTKCILWDILEGSEFYFLSKAGNMVYYASHYSIYSIEKYYYVKFNKDWKPERQYELYIKGVDDNALNQYPNLKETGIFFAKEGNELTKKQFQGEFKKLMGIDFDEMKPEWVD